MVAGRFREYTIRGPMGQRQNRKGHPEAFPLYELADNHSRALGEHLERNTKPDPFSVGWVVECRTGALLERR